MSKPLEGIKVVDLSTYVAGPSCAKVLCDWGAEVVKVEAMSGDLWRYMGGPMKPGCNPMFDLENAGKKCVVINNKTPEGFEVMMKLLAQADVFITNVREDALAKMGLTYDQLKDKFPGLIYGHLLGYGKTGPMKDTPGFDVTVFWGRTGLMDLTANSDGHPMSFGVAAMGDHSTGMNLAGGIAAALVHKMKTGKGDRVCSSLYHAGLYALSSMEVSAQYQDMDVYKQSSRNSSSNGVYKCKDGRYIMFSIPDIDRTYPALCKVLGREDLIGDTRFNTRLEYYKHEQEFTGIFAEAMAKRTADEWEPILSAASIPAQIVFTCTECASDVQALEAGFIKPYTYADGTKVNMPITPMQFDSFEVEPMGPASELGGDTAEVLKGLGYSDEQIASMRAAKAVR